MISPKRQPQHLFLLVIVAVTVIIAGLAIFSAQNNAFTQSAKVTDEVHYRPSPIVLETFADSQNEQSPSTTSIAIDAITPTQTSTEVLNLPPVVKDSHRGLITNGDRSQHKIALTFDVCQSEGDLAGFDASIIQVLNETHTPATFFLGGLWMRDHQAETIELSNNPLFELGNHSWSHKDFSAITNDEMQKEILLTQQFMYDLVGYQTNLFRLPYGTYTDESLNTINDQGLYIIQWDDVSGDPDPNVTAENMTSWVLQQVQPGSIIIMHANGRGWHTAEALPGIIQSLNEQGYSIVTISDLLKIQPYK
jgi:peptidoglycan/xylan/chitin deacetylase (PgdA/CDA1 family)